MFVGERGIIKKTVIVVIAILMSANLVFGINIPYAMAAESVAVKSVKLTDNSITIGVGEIYYLDAEISPQNATTGREMKWSSSNVMVARVDNYGKVTAVKEGRTIIKCELTESGLSDTCVVEVVPSLQSVYIEPEEITLVAGKTRQLSFAYKPSNIDYSHIQEWSSSDPHIASVTRDGLVTARSEGETKILLRYGDLEATCRVKVLAQVQDLSLSSSSVTMSQGDKYSLTVKALPGQQVITDEVVWSSSDPSIVRVNSSGILTAVSKGDRKSVV